MLLTQSPLKRVAGGQNVELMWRGMVVMMIMMTRMIAMVLMLLMLMKLPMAVEDGAGECEGDVDGNGEGDGGYDKDAD